MPHHPDSRQLCTSSFPPCVGSRGGAAISPPHPTPPGSRAPVYFYEFQHRPSYIKDTKPPHIKADHGDEVPFVFGVFAWIHQRESSWAGRVFLGGLNFPQGPLGVYECHRGIERTPGQRKRMGSATAPCSRQCSKTYFSDSFREPEGRRGKDGTERTGVRARALHTPRPDPVPSSI